jgi:propanol-preferring alcohol dehydrogenase
VKNEILIAVEACGVCHSDLHVAQGDWKQFAGIVKKPLILGHEVAGCVARIGPGVRDLQIGDRVGVPWIYWTCGECEFCREGNENLCLNQKITGVTVDGGYAEFLTAPASHALKIPNSVSFAEAAPLFCAGVTVFRALRRAGMSRGQRVAIFGIGGLGHLAVQMAVAMGAEITAVDVTDEKLALAESLGASTMLNAASTNVGKALRARGGMHVALVTSAAKEAYAAAFSCVRPAGSLLAVGLPASDVCFPPILMAATEIQIQATAVGTRDDLRQVLAMAAEGKVRCRTTSRKLDEANAVLEEMRRGEITGRVVLTPH